MLPPRQRATWFAGCPPAVVNCPPRNSAGPPPSSCETSVVTKESVLNPGLAIALPFHVCRLLAPSVPPIHSFDPVPSSWTSSARTFEPKGSPVPTGTQAPPERRASPLSWSCVTTCTLNWPPA
ncbi:MAG: hypothetical protein IPJ77_15025 [Planctomycetes bacterium]|nr:hypothetical protein [Planctomycetota bacterium]